MNFSREALLTEFESTGFRPSIVPSLLTQDKELAERIGLQPGLEWKAQNIREFKSRS